MIAVIDYGRGNLGSVENALGRLGMRAVVTQDPRVIEVYLGTLRPMGPDTEPAHA